jgi:FAD/FMN-containing dehydrogenase
MASISGSNHWWQNWSKTHAYVAERMFFPRSPDGIADAVRTAEADRRPLRAVGGGWSFSDASCRGRSRPHGRTFRS